VDINVLAKSIIKISFFESEMGVEELFGHFLTFLACCDNISEKHLTRFFTTLSGFSESVYRLLFTVFRQLKTSHRTPPDFEGTLSYTELSNFNAKFVMPLNPD
jgi:hypothetical protein